MSLRRTAGRTATSVSVLFAVLAAVVMPAAAVSATRATSPLHSVGSGTYLAVMALRDTATFTAAPLIVTIPAGSTAAVYVKPVDIGVFAMTAAYYKKTNASGAAVTVLQTCTGTWAATVSAANTACSTGTAGIATVDTSGTFRSTALPPAKTLTTGKHFRLLVTTKDNAATTQVRLEVEVRRPDIRTATTTSS